MLSFDHQLKYKKLIFNMSKLTFLLMFMASVGAFEGKLLKTFTTIINIKYNLLR